MNPPGRKELLQRGLELQVREWERAVKCPCGDLNPVFLQVK